MISRILIVGYGSIGKRHLALARQIFPEAVIQVLRHKPSNEVPQHANGCFFTLQQAIDFAPQIAVVASPATHHTATAQAFADIGTHLLIEKPLSVDAEGVKQLINTCNKKKKVLLTGYNLRFLPSLIHFRKLLKSNHIGSIFSVRCEIGQYLPSWRPDSDYRQSVSARSTLGGGVLLELSHEIDYLRWIFGEVEWTSATLRRQSNLDVDVEDTAHLVLGFKQESNQKQLVATLNLDFIRHDTTRLCVAIGENGSLRWNGITGAVEEFKLGGKGWHEVFHYQHARDDSYIVEWEHFINCVSNNEKPLITGVDGLMVLHIIDAARASSQNNNIQIQVESI